MRARIASALILAVLVAVCPRPGTSAPARPAPAPPPAWQLLQKSERSVVHVADAARLSPAGLRAGSPLYAPFWDALEEMDRALAEVRSSLGVRNQRFFSALRGGSRSLAQLRVVWSRTGIHEPAVTRALESLGSSYRPLRTHYGPEQARAEQGGALTPQERDRFREIQRMQVRLIAMLQPLRTQAAGRGDREMTEHVDRLLERANDIASADLTLDEYLEASLSEDELMGEWDGNGPYVEPSYRSAWHAADAAVEELFVAEEASFVFALDLGGPGAKGAGGDLAGVGEPAAPATEQPLGGQPATDQPTVTVYGGAEGEELFDDPLFGDAAEEADPVEVIEEPEITEAGAFEGVEEEASPAEQVISEGAEEAENETAAEEVVEEGKPEEAAPISEEDIPAEDLPVQTGVEDSKATPAAPPAKVPESNAEGERKPPLGVATLAAILPL
ncbi:MAG TPA: hypothetical protein VEL74_00350 [Thermoanaerobaculia bacterium]|nr:hypothetical protein [Thermoanaerobaculia bacterium]